MRRSLPLLAVAALALAFGGGRLLAQQPTQQQRDAIRAACRGDFMANCSGVQPGGREALQCLVEHGASLSPSCKTAVDAIASPRAGAAKAGPPPAAAPSSPPPAAAAAAAPASEDQLKTIQEACTLKDISAHCSWIAPNNPELVLCLKANKADLSPGCLSAVQSLPSAPAAPAAQARPAEPPNPAPAEGTATPEPAREGTAAPPAAAPSEEPNPQQAGAVRAACRSDFIQHCRGVQPGGSAALACLRRNARRLSASCRSAVAALGESPGAPAAKSAPAGEPAPSAAAPAAPLGAMPQLRPREALEVLRECGADRRSLCANVEPGGGRVISCLAEHASSLSPACQRAMRAAAARSR